VAALGAANAVAVVVSVEAATATWEAAAPVLAAAAV
jgi:hypothetical protein